MLFRSAPSGDFLGKVSLHLLKVKHFTQGLTAYEVIEQRYEKMEAPLCLAVAPPNFTIRFKMITDRLKSETGRIRFRRARFQTPSSVSFVAITEFRGENSVSTSQVTVLSKQYSPVSY